MKVALDNHGIDQRRRSGYLIFEAVGSLFGCQRQYDELPLAAMTSDRGPFLQDHHKPTLSTHLKDGKGPAAVCGP